MTLPGWVGVREPRGRLGGRFTKNVTICPTQGCTTSARVTPPHHRAADTARRAERQSLALYIRTLLHFTRGESATSWHASAVAGRRRAAPRRLAAPPPSASPRRPRRAARATARRLRRHDGLGATPLRLELGLGLCEQRGDASVVAWHHLEACDDRVRAGEQPGQSSRARLVRQPRPLLIAAERAHPGEGWG